MGWIGLTWWVLQGAMAEEPDELARFLAMRIETAAPGSTRDEENAAIRESLSGMEAALTGFEQLVAVAAGPATRVEALLDLASANAHMAEALVDSPRPSWLSPGVLELYAAGLQQKAAVYQERRIHALEGALVAGSEAGWTCRPGTMDAAAELVTLLPGKWAGLAFFTDIDESGCVQLLSDPATAAIAHLRSGDIIGGMGLLWPEPMPISVPVPVDDSIVAFATCEALIRDTTHSPERLASAAESYIRYRHFREAERVIERLSTVLAPGRDSRRTLQRLRGQLEAGQARARAIELAERAAEAHARRNLAALADTQLRIAELTALLQKCTESETIEEAIMIIEQAELVVAAAESDMARDMTVVLIMYADSVRQACKVP